MNGKTRQFCGRLTTAPLRWAVNYRGTYARSMRSYGTLYARRRPRSTKLSIADKTLKLVDVICLRNGCHRVGKTTVGWKNWRWMHAIHGVIRLHRSIDQILSLPFSSYRLMPTSFGRTVPLHSEPLYSIVELFLSELFQSISLDCEEIGDKY